MPICGDNSYPEGRKAPKEAFDVKETEVSTTQHATESGIAIAAKAAPPISVSIASVAGYQISEILLWATLIYTVLMICHKIYAIYKDVKGEK
jgi:hypothetical protein